MESIKIDCGIREFRINGKGVLRFNPADPNVYARFEEFMGALPLLAEETADLQTLDTRLKKQLGQVYPGNDFDKILGGVSLLAMAGNGHQVLMNLMEALIPLMEQGMEDYADALAAQVVE